MEFNWVSNRDNFLLRLSEDGKYDIHSDLVARVRVGDVDKRLVVYAGVGRLRKAKPGRARADLVKPLLQNVGISPKTADDLYLSALRQDGAKRVWFTATLLRLNGVLRHQWRYGKVRG